MSYYALGRNVRWQHRFVWSPECDGGKADYLNERLILHSRVGEDLRGLTTLFSLSSCGFVSCNILQVTV